MKIQDNTILITGACSGIGKIMARRSLEKGASSTTKQHIIPDNHDEYRYSPHSGTPPDAA